MKRKWPYLASPLILMALMFGVKWRAEHPTPTKEDLELRALLSNNFDMRFHYFDRINGKLTKQSADVSEQEFEPFIDSFYFLSRTKTDNFSLSKATNTFSFRRERSRIVIKPKEIDSTLVEAILGVDSRLGIIFFETPNGSRHYNIHPVTVKSWLELIQNHPRIGPELRARMK